MPRMNVVQAVSAKDHDAERSNRLVHDVPGTGGPLADGGYWC